MIFSFSFCERIGLWGGNNTQAFVSGFLNWKNENTNVVTLMQCSLTLTGWCHHKHKTLYRYLANGVIFHTLLSFPNIASIFSAPALAVWKSLLRQRYHSPWRPVVGCSSAFFRPLSPQEDIPQSLCPIASLTSDLQLLLSYSHLIGTYFPSCWVDLSGWLHAKTEYSQAVVRFNFSEIQLAVIL